MSDSKETSELKTCLINAADIQATLDMRAFQLKTLNDVSKELFESVDTETIIKHFLLMTMGNVGVLKGFVLLTQLDSKKPDHFVSVGFHESDVKPLRGDCKKCIWHGRDHNEAIKRDAWRCSHVMPHGVEHVFPFTAEKLFQGILGLGPRIVGSHFEAAEKELLDTLINNLVVALKNAQSFEKILTLNRELKEKNIVLGKTLKDLKSAVRKVDLLERIKESLSKFVPLTVANMLESSPTGRLPESKEQDLSVLFLDIEGYTRLCEKFDSTEVNAIVEDHFSVFMDAIHANNGDVNETAGDGLMVLFLDKDRHKNALNAVRTALTIQKETTRIGNETNSLYRPLDIHMGIHSGKALVGATKFNSITGSRWTYTARGGTVNIASRIGSLATGSNILISKETAARVSLHQAVEQQGLFKLKNVTHEVEIYKLLP